MTNRVGRKKEYAHRLAYQQAHGPIPTGCVVMHRCDNPPCFNVEHLVLGMPIDNARDCHTKGRDGHGPTRGEQNPNAKLSAKDVVEIRKRAAAKVRTGFKRFQRGSGVVEGLAVEYGVSRVMIWNIITGRNWK